ncbi:hypothetical protein BDB13_6445 [Rhodococcus sp. OK302]|nr:hypothetical protein BDB13_6445 [Rhodococcus sp. OK302]
MLLVYATDAANHGLSPVGTYAAHQEVALRRPVSGWWECGVNMHSDMDTDFAIAAVFENLHR